jgi:hypothetical protein
LAKAAGGAFWIGVKKREGARCKCCSCGARPRVLGCSGRRDWRGRACASRAGGDAREENSNGRAATPEGEGGEGRADENPKLGSETRAPGDAAPVLATTHVLKKEDRWEAETGNFPDFYQIMARGGKFFEGDLFSAVTPCARLRGNFRFPQEVQPCEERAGETDTDNAISDGWFACLRWRGCVWRARNEPLHQRCSGVFGAIEMPLGRMPRASGADLDKTATANFA